MSATITIEELNEDLSFKSDLMLDESFVIVPQGTHVNETIIKALKTWNFKTLYCEEGFSAGEPEKTVDSKNEDAQQNEPDHPSLTHSTQAVNKAFEKTIHNQDTSERTRLESVQEMYQEYMKYINSVYTHYATHKTINLQKMTQTVQQLCIFIRENKRFVLRITPSIEARNKNYLVVHSMRTTVLAITIAMELHLPVSKIVELGVTTILHEIGMLRIPPQLYLTDRMLSPTEKKQISMHPILGCNILKELNFPNQILLGVLDHHEKENGMGYPRGISSEKISPYGKIISVACSFEAITAPRAYKSERTTYDAMVEMLQNPNRQYDPTIIKALLYSLSLYPIGAYVYLNSGKIAIVTDVTPNKPQNPIVQLINEKENDGSPKTVQTDDNANKIVRVLSKQEQEDVVKNLTLQEEAEKEKIIENATGSGNEKNPQNQSSAEDQGGFSNVDLSEFS